MAASAAWLPRRQLRVPEPAWHRRARRKRSDDRVAAKLAASLARLAHHHGSAMPRILQQLATKLVPTAMAPRPGASAAATGVSDGASDSADAAPDGPASSSASASSAPPVASTSASCSWRPLSSVGMPGADAPGDTDPLLAAEERVSVVALEITRHEQDLQHAHAVLEKARVKIQRVTSYLDLLEKERITDPHGECCVDPNRKPIADIISEAEEILAALAEAEAEALKVTAGETSLQQAQSALDQCQARYALAVELLARLQATHFHPPRALQPFRHGGSSVGKAVRRDLCGAG